jgi:hypothetical protein
MSNYESIPVDTRNIIEDGLRLNDNSKNAVGRLWELYLRINTYDTENAEGELQNFLNSLQQYIGQPETMLNVIDQKINDVEREINGNDFNGRGGIKKRKKRKRTNKKTSKKRSNKRSNKRRKTIKGGKDLTPLYLNKPFYLGEEIKREQEQEQERRRQQLLQQQEIQRQEAEQERERRERERIQREQAWWDQF